MDTLEVEKLEKTGEVPNKILGASLSFYDRAFYLFGYYWPESQSDNTKQELYKYDLALRTWEIVDVLGDKPEHRVYSSTFVYNDELFLVYGVIIDTSETLSSICKFTFASKTWTFLSDVSGDDVINSGIAQYNSFAYLVFGRSSNEIYNSVSYLDLSEAIPKKVYLTTNWDSPSKRKNHCSIVVNDHLLIFGGVTNKGTHLNDIWSFDFTNNHWVYLIVTGAIPSARQQAACTKIRDNGLMIFGGTNLVESFNDLYFFDTTFYVWILITPEAGVSPTPRHSACLAAFNLELFILGGRDDANVYDQFWHFVYLTNKFTLINENDPIKLPIFDYKCWTDIENLAPVVYVIGGRLINFKPVNTIYKIQILEKNKEFSTVTSLHHEYSMALPSQSGFVKSGDYVYLIFGAYWEYISVPYIFELNYKTKAETMWPFDTEYSIYSHIAEHYKDSIYVFGGGISIGRIIMGMSANNNLLKIDRSESVLTRLECSRGTIGDTCEPCKAGYYEQNSECIPCPSGRYSVIIASTTAFQCLPCDYGFFNYKEGNSYCFECLSQDYCPIGSMEPITKGSSPSYLSIQPLEYQPDITLINQLVNNLWYASGGLVCLVLLFGLVFHDLFEKIKKIDCFADSHSQDLNVPVIHRKTKVGGFFTILFALAAGITVIGLFLSYNLNNIIESKSLVPLLTLDTEISAATLEITTAFYVYSGKCVQDSECIPENTFFYAGFEFLSNKTVCKKEGTTCIVSITYYGFSISSTSTVNIQLLESSACASVITVNVTSTSSIPGESSSVFLPIFTGSDFKVFLGAKPTIVNFELTPSVNFI